MMQREPTTIVGAGLAGLIAAHAWPRATVLEQSPEPVAAHQALLRFRTDAVARLCGIEFRRVLVRKGIWSEGGYRAPDIQLANRYALKVLGRVGPDRSIWDLAPVERFVAPNTLHEQMLDNVHGRVYWGHEVATPDAFKGRIVSTMPLPALLALLKWEAPDLGFRRAPITVVRMQVPGVDAFQTVYFPDHDTPLYRASLTGDTLIAEMAGDLPNLPGLTAQVVRLALSALGLPPQLAGETEHVVARQQYGKIAPIDDAKRKHLLFRLTNDAGIYSLGRFATWRNILLDDVVKDVDVIKRLDRQASYGFRLAAGS